MTEPAPTNPSASLSGSPSASPVVAQPVASSPNPTPTNPTEPPARPEWLPEQFSDEKTFRADWDQKTAAHAERETRRLTLPEKPEGYQLLLPKDLEIKGADGKPIKFEFDANDPRIPEARALMHEIDQGKLSGQDAFSRMLAMHAKFEAGEDQRVATARQAEMTKLGANGPARVDALGTWLNSMIGDKGKGLLDRLVLAADVEAFEDLIKKFSSQGVANFSQQHRENGNPPPPKTRAERMFPNMRAN